MLWFWLVLAVVGARMVPVDKWSDIDYNTSSMYALSDSLVFYTGQWLHFHLKSSLNHHQRHPVTGCFRLDIPMTVSYSMQQSYSRGHAEEFDAVASYLRFKFKVAAVHADEDGWAIGSTIQCRVDKNNPAQVAVITDTVRYSYTLRWLKNGWTKSGDGSLDRVTYLECTNQCTE